MGFVRLALYPATATHRPYSKHFKQRYLGQRARAKPESSWLECYLAALGGALAPRAVHTSEIADALLRLCIAREASVSFLA